MFLNSSPLTISGSDLLQHQKVMFGFHSLLLENDLKGILPELFLVSVTIFLLIYGVVLSTSKKNSYPLLVDNLSWLALLSLFFTLILTKNLVFTNAFLFYNTLILDQSTLFFKLVVCIGGIFSILISLDYIKSEGLNGFEYTILILLSTSSMFFLISSADLISLYLGIEFQSLCFYVLAASKRDSEFSTEAGLKYFLLGAFSSGLLLFGFSLIYGFTGITSLSELSSLFTCGAEEISTGISSLRGCELGMVFILVGFLFKSTAVPFHMWAPDVYEGAPLSVTAFFSIAPKVSILAVFVRIFLESFYDFMVDWQKLLIFSSIGSMTLAAFAGMSQNKIKRLLAYSSIGHVGYILIGLCCGTVEGLQALLIYLVIYVLITINIFGIVLLPLRRDPSPSSSAPMGGRGISGIGRLKYTTDFAQMAKTNPLLAFTVTISLFSIAGIPPLAGFYSKAFLFFAAISSAQFLLALVGVVTSVISCFYYIRIVKIMYFETPKNWLTFSSIPKSSSIPLGISLFFILFFMTYPSPLYLATHKVALALSF
jgi:proton-translocating NADH-quinone oxidoreductase chain N